ncbi:hypothetical protein KXV85_000789 [Aspergillus fumigatus]|nr:hypothetical protein KXV85_000789 [Aspergillus fumigatus]
MRSCTSVLVTNGEISGRPNPAPKPNSVIISGSFKLLAPTLADPCCHHGVSRVLAAACRALAARYKSPAAERPGGGSEIDGQCKQAPAQVRGTELGGNRTFEHPGLKAQ